MNGPTQKIHWTNINNNISDNISSFVISHDKLQILIFDHSTKQCWICKKRVTYMVIPGLLFVVYDSSSKTSSRVNTSSSYWDGCQVNHEHSKTNWKWSQNLQKQNTRTITNLLCCSVKAKNVDKKLCQTYESKLIIKIIAIFGVIGNYG